MHVFRNRGPGRTEEAVRLGGLAKEAPGLRRRTAGVALCPRCGGELVARMSRGAPGAFCHCPVRRVRAEAA